MSERYIPSIETLARAAQELPPAASFRGDVFHVPVKDERLLAFRRIKFKGRLGQSTSKWVYEGKVAVK